MYGCHSARPAGTTAAAAWLGHRAGHVDGPERGQSPIWTMLGYTEPMSLSGILDPRNRLPQVSTSEGGVLVEKTGLPGPPRALLLLLLLSSLLLAMALLNPTASFVSSASFRPFPPS